MRFFFILMGLFLSFCGSLMAKSGKGEEVYLKTVKTQDRLTFEVCGENRSNHTLKYFIKLKIEKKGKSGVSKILQKEKIVLKKGEKKCILKNSINLFKEDNCKVEFEVFKEGRLIKKEVKLFKKCPGCKIIDHGFIKKKIQDELQGFIFDETRTPLGNEFYQNFTKYWNPPPGLFKFNIIIKEIVLPKWKSIIKISIGNIVVYQTILLPKKSEIEEKAKRSADYVLKYVIMNWKFLEKMNEII